MSTAKHIEQVITEGIIFKKGKEEVTGNGEKKIKFCTFLQGTHRSGSAKKKAEYKYKRAVRSARKCKKNS
ncbi:MAG: hypothetical protein RR382_10465 [Tannerellaceae bacterium]